MTYLCVTKEMARDLFQRGQAFFHAPLVGGNATVVPLCEKKSTKWTLLEFRQRKGERPELLATEIL